MKTAARKGSTLRQVFPEGEIYAVSDCESLGTAATYYGLESISLADAEAGTSQLPPDANVVLFLRHNMVGPSLRKRFRQASVLVVPIASFDSALEAALYTQKLVMLTDYVSACAQGRYWVDNIKNQAGSLVFSSAGAGQQPAGAGSANGHERTGPEYTNLTCTFSDALTAGAWLEPVIRPGQWVSVGSYCELSMTTRPSPDRQPPFILNGTAVASGVLTARDPRYSEAGDARIRAAITLRRELVAAAPITLRLEDGTLTKVCAGGQDFTDAVREVTNPEYGLSALELGIGTNQGVLPEVKWQVNSQMNEGAGPVHLGFGEGVTGAHMDFIVAKSAHRFTTSLGR